MRLSKFTFYTEKDTTDTKFPRIFTAWAWRTPAQRYVDAATGSVAACALMVQPARLMKAPRKRFRRRASDPRCCAEAADACPPNGPCCTPVSALRQGAAAACALLGSRETCGRGYVEAGEPASEYCVWLGGRCTLGASADCREAYDPYGSSYYGEVQG